MTQQTPSVDKGEGLAVSVNEIVTRLALVKGDDGQPRFPMLREPHILLWNPLVVCSGHTNLYSTFGGGVPIGESVFVLAHDGFTTTWMEEQPEKPCLGCQGRGFVPVTTMDALMDAGKPYHFQIWWDGSLWRVYSNVFRKGESEEPNYASEDKRKALALALEAALGGVRGTA